MAHWCMSLACVPVLLFGCLFVAGKTHNIFSPQRCYREASINSSSSRSNSQLVTRRTSGMSVCAPRLLLPMRFRCTSPRARPLRWW
uniref:Putative secreted peptide n=1 Tax=Anopheles braziliensis TaxID=58242 RepID=A0A2M3ZQY5_9DIPT